MRHEDIPAHLNDLTDRVIGAAIEVHKHLGQLVSYMRAGGYPIGLLLNFNVPVMHKGVSRRINPVSPSVTSASPRSTSSSGGSR